MESDTPTKPPITPIYHPNNNNNTSNDNNNNQLKLSSSDNVNYFTTSSLLSNSAYSSSSSSATLQQRNSTNATSPAIVYLNVGGYTYATSMTTLQMDPSSMLSRMFSGLLPTALDAKGRYFIDRDGKLFRYILNYLRDGYVTVTPKLTREVLQEARFFGLTHLCEVLEETLPAHTSAITDDVRKIRHAAKIADQQFRTENDAAIDKLTKFLLNHTETIYRQNGSNALVEISINTNYFAPPLFKAAGNSQIRKVVLDDLKKEGLVFTVTEHNWTREKGTEWKFVLTEVDLQPS